MYKCIITIMERRAKMKRENSLKRVENKAPSFITDVKSIKENSRIKEILKTVKMNSSMRIKTPKGSRVMNNKDFVDDLSDELMNNETEKSIEPQAAVNSDVNLRYGAVQDPEAINDSVKLPSEDLSTSNNLSDVGLENNMENKSNNLSVDSINATKNNGIPEVVINLQPQSENPQLPHWNRKLSLDHTMLKRCEGLSQSELDLHSIGKSPLERKSSFFRKKMDSFFKNTTEIFKRQSVNSKSGDISRRGSMSVSLQSLNQAANDDNAAVNFNKLHLVNNKAMQLEGSVASLLSQSTVGHSESSQSVSQSDRPAADQTDQGGLVGSQPMLSSSQTFGAISSSSINSLNEGYPQDALLNSRAISMSSGLDSANGQQRRKKSRSNRVTWVASEGLTNYFRRLIQDEKSSDVQVCHSYQDLSNIPEVDMYAPKLDSKGRRLSYQRAVSGEDPVHPPRYQDSPLKRRSHIPENSEVNYELSNQLAEFSRNGVPPLKGFCIAPIPDEAFAYLHWAERAENLDEFYDWKKLGANEEARQAVIRELIFTEADYIKHLIAIVEVFMAAAHALQDGGKLLDIETERLFSNVPDVLNASLLFWESSIYPMLADAVEKGTPFNTELMAPGFCRFRDLFTPYEKFVGEQTRALDYLRSLSSNADFMMYLSWCHSQKSCNRLQLSDILVKPMQRLTKYRLILRRIIAHTDTEPERTSLIAMESFSKNYVLDLNRSIRQREELEKLDALASSIDTFEMDFKDEDMDRYFRMYASLNLKAPMANCLPSHSRTLIHQGDLRFKDNVKETDVRAILLTDMLLICKKLSKGSPYQYKLIRPKYMIEKMIQFPKFSSRKELVALIFVMVDEVGSSYQSFALSEPTKDPNGQSTLKLWEQKVKEAKLTYDLGVWFAKNPSRDLSEVEMDSSSDYALSGSSKMGMKQNSDDLNIEREARERVAAMLHRSMGASTEYDFSQASMTTDSFDEFRYVGSTGSGEFRYVGSTGSGAGEISGITGMSGARTPGLHNLRHPMHRNSTGSSRNSRLSSFNQSTSAASHDEPQAGPSRLHYRAGSSVEHLIPPMNPEDAVTSITVNVVSESESETIVPVQQPPPPPSPRLSHNTLHVQPQSGVMALVHSLPDLTIEPSPTRSTQSTSPQSASEKLYTSHQELLQRNRLSASQHHQYLSPHHRGTSYPPPSPTRGSLKRSLAFSYSFKNPPLSKMGHVNSQAQLPADTGPSTSQQHKVERDTTSSPTPGPSTSTDKKDKKSKQVSTRNKGGSSLSLNRKEDKGD